MSQEPSVQHLSYARDEDLVIQFIHKDVLLTLYYNRESKLLGVSMEVFILSTNGKPK